MRSLQLGVASAVLIAGVSITSAGQAFDPYAYVKAQATFHYFDLEGQKKDLKKEDVATALEARAGYMFNPFFGAETRMGVGTTDAKLNYNAANCYDKVNVPFYTGGYARAQVPLGNSAVTPYALAGLTHIKTRVSNNCTGATIAKTSNTDFAYGAGLDFNYNAYTAGLEVMHHQEDITSIGVNIGVNLSPKLRGYSVRKAKVVKMKPLRLKMPTGSTK